MSTGGGFLRAVGLLTRVPVSPSHLPGAGVAWFPVVGGLIGLAGAAVYWLAHLLVPPLLAATLAVTALILLTGGLHEDGLADYADALASGTSGEVALEVMGDPRVGTFGALALVISLTWRTAAISALEPSAGMVWLVTAHALARSGAAGLAGMLPAARTAGLGRSIVEQSGPRARSLAVLGGAMVGLVVGIWAVPALLLAGASVLAVRRSARRLLGGVTGDVLGVCEQMIEVGVLTLAVAVAGLPIPRWDGLL